MGCRGSKRKDAKAGDVDAEGDDEQDTKRHKGSQKRKKRSKEEAKRFKQQEKERRRRSREAKKLKQQSTLSTPVVSKSAVGEYDVSNEPQQSDKPFDQDSANNVKAQDLPEGKTTFGVEKVREMRDQSKEAPGKWSEQQWNDATKLRQDGFTKNRLDDGNNPLKPNPLVERNFRDEYLQVPEPDEAEWNELEAAEKARRAEVPVCRRKRVRCDPDDDTLYEIPTEMPDVVFGDELQHSQPLY